VRPEGPGGLLGLATGGPEYSFIDPAHIRDRIAVSGSQASNHQRNRSIGSGRLQKYNHPGAVLGRCEPAIRLHVVAGHDLIGFRDEAIEVLLVPYKIRALHGAGIAVVLERTGFPSDNIVEVRTQAIVAFLGRVAGPACVVKCLLPRLGVGRTDTLRLGSVARHAEVVRGHRDCNSDEWLVATG
jgi:hypothetical protein